LTDIVVPEHQAEARRRCGRRTPPGGRLFGFRPRASGANHDTSWIMLPQRLGR